jgi:hypothetical protein
MLTWQGQSKQPSSKMEYYKCISSLSILVEYSHTNWFRMNLETRVVLGRKTGAKILRAFGGLAQKSVGSGLLVEAENDR